MDFLAGHIRWAGQHDTQTTAPCTWLYNQLCTVVPQKLFHFVSQKKIRVESVKKLESRYSCLLLHYSPGELSLQRKKLDWSEAVSS